MIFFGKNSFISFLPQGATKLGIAALCITTFSKLPLIVTVKKGGTQYKADASLLCNLLEAML